MGGDFSFAHAGERGRSPHAMGLDAAWALEWLAAIRRHFHARAEHNLDAIVCFDN